LAGSLISQRGARGAAGARGGALGMGGTVRETDTFNDKQSQIAERLYAAMRSGHERQRRDAAELGRGAGAVRPQAVAAAWRQAVTEGGGVEKNKL